MKPRRLQHVFTSRSRCGGIRRARQHETERQQLHHQRSERRRHRPARLSPLYGVGRHGRRVGARGRSSAVDPAEPNRFADRAAEKSIFFAQISDSHIGFSKDANKDVTATLQDAVVKLNALPQSPAFVLHTGDITQLAKARGIRHRAASALGREEPSGSSTSRVSMTSRPTTARRICNATARARAAAAGTASTTAVCTSSVSSTC